MKKIISLIIVLAFVLTCATTTVSALDIMWAHTEDMAIYDITNPASWYIDAYQFSVTEHLLTSQTVKSERVIGIRVYYKNFLGERNVTRAEVATVMSRYNGSYDTIFSNENFYKNTPGYKSFASKTFTDVPSGKWMTPAVEWAAENGIVEGVGGTSFAPKRNITREEFAAILYRYTQFKEVNTDKTADLGKYSDGKSVSNWAKEAMSWAVAEGLITGKPGGLLAPKDNITRAEVAVVIYRYNNTILAHSENYKSPGE